LRTSGKRYGWLRQPTRLVEEQISIRRDHALFSRQQSRVFRSCSLQLRSINIASPCYAGSPQMLSSLNLKWQGHYLAFLEGSIPEHRPILYAVAPT